MSLRTIGAVCALLTAASFVAGIALLVAGGVEVLIPESGQTGLDWIEDVDSAGGLFFAGGWLVNIGGVFALVAFLGFYDVLRAAGPAMILAPVLGVVGMVLVTISHLIPVALGYEFVPGYVNADAAEKATLAVTLDTLSSVCLVLNYAGDVLLWGVVAPLFAWAVLKTGALPRWIGWLGIVGVGFFGGWLGAFSPAWSVIDGLTFIGFVAFFVFMASMGIALLRKRPVEAA